MKTKMLLIFICSIISLQSCTTYKMKMVPVSTLDQKIGYDGSITSHKKHFVSLSPYNNLANIYSKTDFLKDKKMFILNIQNDGEKPVQIGYDNISVVFEGNNKDGSLNKIIVKISDDFVYNWENEYNDSEKKYVYSEIYHTYLCANMGACNPMDQLDDLKYHLEAMRRQNQVLRETLSGIVIKPQSIMPGTIYFCIIVCDTPGLDAKTEGNFRIMISIDGEDHKFIFKRSMSK